MEQEDIAHTSCNETYFPICDVNSDVALDSDSESSCSTSSSVVLYPDDRDRIKDVNLSLEGGTKDDAVVTDVNYCVTDVNYSLYVSGRCVACEQWKVASISKGDQPVASVEVFPDEMTLSNSSVVNNDEGQKSLVSLENFIREAYARVTPRPVLGKPDTLERTQDEYEPLYSPRRLRSAGSVSDLPNVQPKVLERRRRRTLNLS
jgi:hypothetical protein